MSIGYMNAPQEVDEDHELHDLSKEGPIFYKTVYFPVEVTEVVVVIEQETSGADCNIVVRLRKLGQTQDGPTVASFVIPRGAKKGSVYRANLAGSGKPAVRANIGDRIILYDAAPCDGKAEIGMLVRRAQQPAPAVGVNGYYEVTVQ